MRRPPNPLLAILAVVASAAIAACSSGAAPGWTYAPAASASAAASGAASGAPSGSPAASASIAPSTAPSVEPSASGSPAASGGGASLTITAPVGAATAGFQPTTLDAPANAAFTLTFDNQDNQAMHNLILTKPDGSNVPVQGDTAFFMGPGQRVYQVPALQSGTYPFMCQVHPTTMKGTLEVK